jgi:Outer membrane efflux protein
VALRGEDTAYRLHYRLACDAVVTATTVHRDDVYGHRRQPPIRTGLSEEFLSWTRHYLRVRRSPDRGLDIGGPHLVDVGEIALPEALPVNLIGRRADLIAARWRGEAASQGIAAARPQFLPNSSLSAMAGFITVGDKPDVLQLPDRTYGFGPALTLPIFNGGRLRANLASANAAYDEPVARYNTLNQVSDILFRVEFYSSPNRVWKARKTRCEKELPGFAGRL